MNLGAALKRVRFEKGMKQIDVAAKAKVSQTYLSQLESGNKEASQSVVRGLCKVYDIPIATLYWMAMEPSDVKKSKLAIYNKLKPTIDELVTMFLKHY